jgi:hypothetical protein
VEINNPALDGQIWDVEIPAPEVVGYGVTIGEAPAGWSWDTGEPAQGKLRIVTGSSPLVHGKMHYFSIVLTGSGQLPEAFTLLASGADGSTLGGFGSDLQTAVTASIQTDQASYQIGDPIHTCVEVSQPGLVTVDEELPDASRTQLVSAYDDGRGGCFDELAHGPPGTHHFIVMLQTYTNQSVTAQTAFTVLQAAEPQVSLSPSSIPFGSEVVGMTTGFQMVTLTNTGTATLSFSVG